MRTKQKSKKILKLLAMSFAVVLLLWNCKKDEAIPETTQDVSQKTNRFTTKKVKLASFEDNEKLMERLGDFKKLGSTSRVTSRVLVDEQSGIAIDTDYGTYLEDSETGYHSYTFPVMNDTLGNVKNIWLSLKQDGTYDEYLVTYDLTAAEKQLLSLGQVADLDLTNKTSFELLNTNFSGNMTSRYTEGECDMYYELVHHRCSGDGHHILGADECTALDAWDEWVFVIDCPDIGGGGGSSNNNNNDSNNNNTNTGGTSGYSGGGSGSGSYPQTGTVPTYVSPTQIAVNNYFNNLTPDQQDCLDANSGNFDPNNPSASTPSLESQINHFLLANINLNSSLDSSGNPVPDPATEFADEAIDAICGGASVDFPSTFTYTQANYPGLSEGLPFNWWNDSLFVENNISFNLDDDSPHLTALEKFLIAMYPARALIIKSNVEVAETETTNRFGTNGINDRSDAFRHAYFNAMNSNDAGDFVSRLFSNAHESEVPSSLILEKTMDLFNNNIGHTVGSNASFFVSNVELSNQIYQKILDGDLRYLSPINYSDPNFWDNPLTANPDDGHHGITSSTQLIPTN